MNQHRAGPTRFFVVALALLGAAACDVSDPLEGVELILDVTDAPVEVDAASGTVPLRANETSAVNGSVSNETDIEEVRELRRIRLDPSFFSFEPGAAQGAQRSAASGAADGSITVGVFFNGVPIPGLPLSVSVSNGAVSDVQPRTIDLASAGVDDATLDALLAELPASEQPNLEAWQGLSMDEIIQRINQGLASQGVPLSVVTRSEGLDGTFRFEKFEFEGQVSVSR